MNESQISILALISGEHIIADVTTSEGFYFCTKPMQIGGEPDPATGVMKMGIGDFMPYADPAGGFAVPINMAILALPREQLLNAYQKATGSIFTPPSQKIILPS